MVGIILYCFFFFQAEDGIRDFHVTGVQTCALPISCRPGLAGCATGSRRPSPGVPSPAKSSRPRWRPGSSRWSAAPRPTPPSRPRTPGGCIPPARSCSPGQRRSWASRPRTCASASNGWCATGSAAGDKRALARASAYAVNATGLLVMVSVFTATAFIPTGIELAVAGGTSVAAQKVLEAIFGDQAVRQLADRARDDLLDRVKALYAEEAARFTAVLDKAGVDAGSAKRLRAAAIRVAAARQASPLPAGGGS